MQTEYMQHHNKKNQTAERPKVFGYVDYRLYLKDVFTHKKQTQRGYSYRAFSKAAGFTSPNFLKLVMEGKRNIGPDSVPCFSQALSLSGAEAEYFAALVRMQQTTSDEEKERCFWRMRELMPHERRRELKGEALSFLSHWIYPVLREMVSLQEFREDPYWITRRLGFPLNVAEVSAAWEFLKKEGYIKKVAGRWQSQDAMVFSSDEISSLAVRNFHQQMLTQASWALRELPLEDREFGALITGLPMESVAELKEKIKKFRKDVHLWAVAQCAERQKTDVVVQLNIQAYPHTKRIS